jgi:hypothetical protein
VVNSVPEGVLQRRGSAARPPPVLYTFTIPADFCGGPPLAVIGGRRYTVTNNSSETIFHNYYTGGGFEEFTVPAGPSVFDINITSDGLFSCPV